MAVSVLAAGVTLAGMRSAGTGIGSMAIMIVTWSSVPTFVGSVAWSPAAWIPAAVAGRKRLGLATNRTGGFNRCEIGGQYLTCGCGCDEVKV